MKRGYFVYELVITIGFLGAVIIATFFTLSDKTNIIEAPLGADAAQISGAYTSAETDVFLPRELAARYAVENAVYVIASGGGTKGMGSCTLNGKTTTEPTTIDYRYHSIEDVKAAFAAVIKETLAKDTTIPAYEISIGDPLIVAGVPLQPEQIDIPVAFKKYEGVQINHQAYYATRRSFEVKYAYPLEKIYDELARLNQVPSCQNRQNQEGVTQCIKALLAPQQGDITAFTVEGTGPYTITAVQNVVMPSCINKPTTNVQFTVVPNPNT